MECWSSRLAIQFIKADGTVSTITPIDSFTPNVETPHEIIDSIDQDNVCYSKKNQRFTFDFTVKGLNQAVMREMFAAQLKGEKFTLGMVNATPSKNEWVWDSVKMLNCVFTKGSPSEVTNDGGVPVMTFSGMALGINVSKLGFGTVSNRS